MPHPLPLTPGHALTLEQDHGAVIRRTILPGGVRVFTTAADEHVVSVALVAENGDAEEE